MYRSVELLRGFVSLNIVLHWSIKLKEVGITNYPGGGCTFPGGYYRRTSLAVICDIETELNSALIDDKKKAPSANIYRVRVYKKNEHSLLLTRDILMCYFLS